MRVEKDLKEDDLLLIKETFAILQVISSAIRNTLFKIYFPGNVTLSGNKDCYIRARQREILVSMKLHTRTYTHT